MSIRRRLQVIAGVLCLAYLVLAGRLFHLTIVDGEDYRKRAGSLSSKNEILPARRAPILDRYDRLLAVDEPAFDLHVRLAEQCGEASIRRTARALRIGEGQLRAAVTAIEERIGSLSEALDQAGAASMRAPSYLVPGLKVRPSEEVLLEFEIAPDDYWGFKLEPLGDGEYELYVCLVELRGDAALARIESISEGFLSVERIREAMALKFEWIDGEVTHRLGDRADNPKRRAKVKHDLMGWSLPILLDVDPRLADVAALHPELLVGFEIHAKPERRYPHGEVGFNVVGQVRRFRLLSETHQENLEKKEAYEPDDFVGLTGMESACEEQLHGRAGYQLVERKRKGGGKRIVHPPKPAEDGKTVVLTLDLDLQLAAEAALDRVSRPGAVVVMDARNGEVLAMASSPRYDPQDLKTRGKELANARPSVFLNRCVTGDRDVPPGSVFKLVTAIAGLEEGTLDPVSTSYDCASSFRPSCTNHTSDRGPIGLREALAVSCNVFFASAAIDAGRGLDRWIEKFGFGQNTGIELWENRFNRATVKAQQSRRPGERKMIGIGQIIEASPLQIARMTSVFANGGTLVTPHLVLGGDVEPGRHLGISAENLAAVRGGLEDAVDSGTASQCGLDRLRMAGKTGSSEGLPDADTGSIKTHAWFTGYAPRENPEVVITVFIDHIGHGGDFAAPVAADVLEAYYRIAEERGR